MIPSFLFALASSGSLAASRLIPTRRTTGDVYGGVNVTQAVLDVQSAISSPKCNATISCLDLVDIVVPGCLGQQGSAECWCLSTDVVMGCATCMTNSTDGTTSAAQMQTAMNGHMAYHVGCAAFEDHLNATVTSASASASSSTGSANPSTPLPSTAIAGIAIGAIIGTVLITAVAFFCYRRNRRAATNREPSVDVLPAPYFGGLDPPIITTEIPHAAPVSFSFSIVPSPVREREKQGYAMADTSMSSSQGDSSWVLADPPPPFTPYTNKPGEPGMHGADYTMRVLPPGPS